MSALYSDQVLLPDGLQAAVVRVEGARIREVEQLAEGAAVPDDAIDLSGHLITPALVNAHTHLPMSSLRSLGGVAARQGNVVEEVWFAIESRLTAADVRAFTRWAALECLLCGTGAVFEHYYFGRAVADALADVGMSGVIAPTLQDVNGPGVRDLEEQLAATLAIRDDDALAERGIVAVWGPHATDTVSPTLWRTLLDAADLPVHIHVAQSIEELRRAAAKGRTPVELLDEAGALQRTCLLVHGLYVTDADREMLDPAKHLFGHCPWSQTQFAWPAPVDRWLDGGFQLAVGTDAGACNDSMNVQQELRLMACGPAYGLAGFDAFARTGTLDAAEGLEARRRYAQQRGARRADPRWLLSTVGEGPGRLVPHLGLGRLAAGALANVAIWDLSHPALWPAFDPLRSLAFGDAAPALHGLVVAGQWVGELGRVRAVLEHDDVAQWRQEAAERLAALLS